MSAITPFRLSARVTVRYPAVPDSRRANLKLFPPQNSAQRYEPRPLVADADVIENSRLVGKALNPCSTYPVSAVTRLQYFQNLLTERPLSNGLGQLFFDMNVCTSLNGDTLLLVATYTRDDLDWVEVGCKFSLYFPGNDVITKDFTYNFTLSAFEAVKSDVPWYRDILHLIYRKSDMAVLHVAKELSRQDLIDIDIQWRPKRLPDYERAGTAVSAIVTDSADMNGETTCPVCRCDYDDNESGALRLRCNKNHLLCRQCFPLWVDAATPDKATCPHCRAKLYDPADIHDIKFGTTGLDYLYSHQSNRLYSDFENWERSCADLDLQYATDNTQNLTVNRRLFRRIWEHLVQHALEEPASFTPLEHQIVRTEGFKLVQKHIFALIDAHHGELTMTHILFSNLMRNTNDDLTDDFMQSELWDCTSRRDIEHIHGGCVWCVCRLHEGLAAFVERMLSRTLMFHQVRKSDEETSGYKWHLHGDAKAYYNPEIWAAVAWIPPR